MPTARRLIELIAKGACTKEEIVEACRPWLKLQSVAEVEALQYFQAPMEGWLVVGAGPHMSFVGPAVGARSQGLQRQLLVAIVGASKPDDLSARYIASHYHGALTRIEAWMIAEVDAESLLLARNLSCGGSSPSGWPVLTNLAPTRDGNRAAA